MAGPINTTQPLAIPTVPQRLIDANNAPVGVTFAPWGADPFANEAPPYTGGVWSLQRFGLVNSKPGVDAAMLCVFCCGRSGPSADAAGAQHPRLGLPPARAEAN